MRDENGRFPKGSSGNPNGRPVRENTRGYSQVERRKDYKLRHNFGITLQEYWELYEKQGGVCAICGKQETRTQHRGTNRKFGSTMLHVDHDHITGEIRGLLCYMCNTAIGKLGDDSTLLRRAVDYLEGNKDNPQNTKKTGL